jgi:hypothetical protein
MIAAVQAPMLYDLSLRWAGFLTGGALVASHGYALWKAKETGTLARAFPRSRTAGTALIALAALWCVWVVASMELGEFARYKTLLLLAIPAGAWALWKYVPEFLAVRALGMLLLLVAEPLLEAAFHRPESSRLLLVTLVYAWIVAGMFLVGMPYLLRDAIGWLTASERRWKLAAAGGAAYGALLCALSFLW